MEKIRGFISERQCFRMGLMETITISMISIPYLTLRAAQGYHLFAFGLGLLFAALYGGAWFFYSKFVPEGYVNAVNNYMGWSGKILEMFYVIRYVLRVGLLIIFFAKILQQFLLRSFSIWSIVIVFLLICGYGALQTTKERGRLMELLFWWMFVPIILMVVLSISNVDWNEIEKSFGTEGDWRGIFSGAYGVLLALSPMELALYNLTEQKRNTFKSYTRFLVWMVLSLVLAYIVIVGILGGGWTKSSPTAAVNVMEAAMLKSGVMFRFDYPVMAFWIIGVFATVSGFLQHTKEYACGLCGVKTPRGIKCMVAVLCVLVLGSIWVYEQPNMSGYLIQYLMYVDLGLGLFLPGVVVLVKKYGMKKTGKYAVCVAGVAVGICVSFFDGDGESGFLVKNFSALDERQSSLENRDYVTEFSVKENIIKAGEVAGDGKKSFLYQFSIAQLGEYKGDQSMETTTFSATADTLEEALDSYYRAQERQLDLGHISCIRCNLRGEELDRLLFELGELPGIPKSVDFVIGDVPFVTVEDDKRNVPDEKKYILREMIKAAYGRESLR